MDASEKAGSETTLDVNNRVEKSSESLNAVEGAATAVAAARARPSLAALIAAHILRDGEVVLLLIKPSMWYILLSSLRFIAVVLILAIGGRIYDEQFPGSRRTYVEAASFLIAGRIMWATLSWMGRIYVLTDMRILRLSGVFTVDVFECPLRKIARTRIVRTVREQCFHTGSIEIIPSDEERPIDSWQTISRPKEIHEQVVAAIIRAKQGPFSCT